MQIPFNQQFSNQPLEELAKPTRVLMQGDVPLLITGADVKQTNNGAGMAVVIDFVAMAGQYEGAQHQEWFNVVNANQKAVEIAYQNLAKLSQAIGLNAIPRDTSELITKRLIGTFKVEKGKPYTDKDGLEREGADQCKITTYKPFAQVNAQPQQAANPFQQQAQPQQQQQSGNPFLQSGDVPF